MVNGKQQTQKYFIYSYLSKISYFSFMNDKMTQGYRSLC